MSNEIGIDIVNCINKKTETQGVDFKQSFDWKKDTKARLGLIKDILAMANTRDGGKIIIGFEDGTFKALGVPIEHYNQFEVTDINNVIREYSDPNISVNIHTYTYEGKNILVLEVGEFSEDPILCKKEGFDHSQNKNILKKGALYIRTGRCSSEEIPSSDVMRELLGRALTKKGETLLNSMERLLSGRPAMTRTQEVDNNEQLLKRAQGMIDSRIPIEYKDLGYCRVTAYPINSNSNLLQDHKSMKISIMNAAVHSRGWIFPYYENSTNITDGIELYFNNSFTQDYSEGYQLYKNGFFYWFGNLQEDISKKVSNDGNNILGYERTIYRITEYLQFLKRLYVDELGYQGDISISIEFGKMLNRELVPYDSFIHLSGRKISNEDIITITRTISSSKLAGGWKEEANDIIRELFALFNFDNLTFEVIEGWQIKLLNQK